MKKVFSILSAIIFLFHLHLSAQGKKDQSLLTIAGKPITKSDFEKVYKKNNSKDASFDKKSVSEYLELFINYKLKVREAEEMHLDTSEAFKNELSGYKKQLSQPYLIDKDVNEQLIKEAYDRSKTDVRASHILIKVLPDALPRDTMNAYNRILKIREMLLSGTDFNKLAKDSSEDPSAKENGGDLGYFTSMQMVYPFENAAYNEKGGELSMPVRTRFGYHIIKVIDKRPAQGEIHVAHIMVKSTNASSAADSIKAKNKIDEISKKLKEGGNFEDLAKQLSEDQGSARNGGTLPWFGTGRMVPEFEKAAFALKNDGDISAPIKSAYGWHIIKRLEKKPVASFEEMQAELKGRIAKDSRSEIGKLSKINKIKEEYKFKEFADAKTEFLKTIDSSIVAGTWGIEKAKSLHKPMFTLLDKKFTQQDFGKFVVDHEVKRKSGVPEAIVNSLYEQFVNESCLSFKEGRLELESPDFKTLMEEYRDGILLFDLTDKKVWTKAVKDTMCLKDFYEKNKNNYMWGERLNAVIYTCQNAESARQIKKWLSDGVPADTISARSASDTNVSIKDGKFSKGDNDIIDAIKWVKGNSPDKVSGNSIVFVHVYEVIPPQGKTLDEARGLVTADYQSYLEKEWIDSLRKKYPVTVNREVLLTISE